MAIPERVQQEDNQAPEEPRGKKDPKRRGVLRTLGLGLITGAADDDPSAIGTYASAGAAIGLSLHVAVKPGSRGRDRDGPPPAGRS